MVIKKLSHLIDSIINIPFNEWNGKNYNRIGLYINDSIDKQEFKRTSYYLINGYFCESNQFRIDVDRNCIFNISVNSFDNEVTRNPEIVEAIKNKDMFRLVLDLKRTSKRTIRFKNIEIFDI